MPTVDPSIHLRFKYRNGCSLIRITGARKLMLEGGNRMDEERDGIVATVSADISGKWRRYSNVTYEA
jgi:hypothetical protein